MNRLHRSLFLMLSLCLVLTAPVAAHALSPVPLVQIERENVTFLSSAPYMTSDGEIMLPLREISIAMGLQVCWDETQNAAVVTDKQEGSEITVAFTPRSYFYTVTAADKADRQEKILDTPAVLQGGTMYMPAQAVAAFGYSAVWDDISHTLCIEKSTQSDAQFTVTGSYIEKLQHIFLTLLENDSVSCTIHFPNLHTTMGIVDTMNQAYTAVVYQYPELGNYMDPPILKASVKRDGLHCELTFAERTDGFVRKHQAYDAAVDFLHSLYHKNVLSSSMSEYERAKVILLELKKNVRYEKTDMFSYTAWSLFARKSGVCQAYTAAYNLLLKLDGIACRGQDGYTYGQGHIWTIATLDGHEYHIDATWDASRYFALTAEQMAKDHIWE